MDIDFTVAPSRFAAETLHLLLEATIGLKQFATFKVPILANNFAITAKVRHYNIILSLTNANTENYHFSCRCESDCK